MPIVRQVVSDEFNSNDPRAKMLEVRTTYYHPTTGHHFIDHLLVNARGMAHAAHQVRNWYAATRDFDVEIRHISFRRWCNS